MSDNLERRAREWLIEWNSKQKLHPSQDECVASLAKLLGEGQRWTCPDCGYDSMPHPPKDYHICPKCMVEFGNDDRKTALAEREVEIRNAALEEAAVHLEKYGEVYETEVSMIRDLKHAATAAQGETFTTPLKVTVVSGNRSGCTDDAIREAELCRSECYEGGTGGRVHYCYLAKGHSGDCKWDLGLTGAAKRGDAQ